MPYFSLREYESGRGAHFGAGLPLDFGSIEGEYRALRGSAGWVDLSHWTKIRVHGEDQWEWLQGQISNDVSILRERGEMRACLLKPTGQIIADLTVVVWGESLVLIARETPPSVVLGRLTRMVVLEDVALEDITSSFVLVAFQGPGMKDMNIRDKIKNEGVRVWEEDVSGSGGVMLLASEEGKDSLIALLEEMPPVGLEAWDIARIEAGLPLHGRDFDERTLVMELGDPFVAFRVSLEKGCYTGQEVVARVVSRGHTNRTWVGLRGEAPMESGALVQAECGKEVGRVTSVAVSPLLGPVGCAFVRNEFAREGTAVEVGGIRAQVCSFPLFRCDAP